MEYDPGFKNPYLNLAKVYAATSRPEAAAKVLDVCLEQGACKAKDVEPRLERLP